MTLGDDVCQADEVFNAEPFRSEVENRVGKVFSLLLDQRLE